jgi:tryptophan 2,3-dioxygenase
MDRHYFTSKLSDPAQLSQQLDYGLYLACDRLLACQKPFDQLCNHDEMQFQIVHQVEELWMKLMVWTLLEIDDDLKSGWTLKVLTLFGRVHGIQRMMIQQLALLETMSPKEYQTIRLQLGNGSGQESPGFRLLLEMPPHLWRSYTARYLEPTGRTVASVYDAEFAHDEAYVVAESLIEFDALFQLFRSRHLMLIHRSIGLGANSLKGRSVDLLQAGVKHRFFPELWDIRVAMTDAWGGVYGRARDSLSQERGA